MLSLSHALLLLLPLLLLFFVFIKCNKTKKKLYGRYRKSGDEVEEDLLVLLRCPLGFSLGKRQTYSANDIKLWQERMSNQSGTFPRKVSHLNPKDWQVTDEFMVKLVESQNPSHLRFGRIDKNGVNRFYALQGVQDTVPYEVFSEIPDSCNNLTHMTKTSTAQSIYNKELIVHESDPSVCRQRKNQKRKLGDLPKEGGWLCGMGRNLHTLGFCELHPAGYVCASDKIKTLVTHKVVENAKNREKYECAIGIDLKRLYSYYPKMKKSEIGIVNEVGTVIIFVDVPYECLIFGKDGPIDATTFWKGITSDL